MEIIPVIDVRHGVAVRGVAGERAGYGALATPLAQGSDPVAIAEGFRALYPFRTLYVADLDGIEGRGANAELQERLAAAWGGSEVWIDDGSSVAAAGTGPLCGRVPVIGSESLLSPSPHPSWGKGEGEGLQQALAQDAAPHPNPLPASGERGNSAWVLSLDFRGDEFLGPRELLEDAALWPDRVIVMGLARVGTGDGPDLERLSEIVRRAGNRSVYAAGGVRGPDDLSRLRDAGAAGALIATALHEGKIKAGDLAEIVGP